MKQEKSYFSFYFLNDYFKEAMMKKKSILVLLPVIGLIVLLGGFALFIKRIFFYNYLSEVVLTENFAITSEWKEIGNPDLLKITKENHYISIMLQPPFDVDPRAGGIKTPEGSIINPDIKVIGDDGHEYVLSLSGSRRFESNTYANYKYVRNNVYYLPINKKYSKILIRSDYPLEVKQIIWTGFNPQDLP